MHQGLLGVELQKHVFNSLRLDHRLEARVTNRKFGRLAQDGAIRAKISPDPNVEGRAEDEGLPGRGSALQVELAGVVFKDLVIDIREEFLLRLAEDDFVRERGTISLV